MSVTTLLDYMVS